MTRKIPGVARPLGLAVVRRKLEAATKRDVATFGRLSGRLSGCYYHSTSSRYWCGVCLNEMFGPGPAYCVHCEIEWGAPERWATDTDYTIWLKIDTSRRARRRRATVERAAAPALFALLLLLLLLPLAMSFQSMLGAGTWLGALLIVAWPLNRAVDRRDARRKAMQALCEAWRQEQQSLWAEIHGSHNLLGAPRLPPVYSSYEEWPQSDLETDPVVLLERLRQRQARGDPYGLREQP